MGLRILHIAPLNTSGVPITFVRAERALGHESRLITLARDRRGYEEDVCLELPLLDFWGTRLVKRLVSNPAKLTVTNRAAPPASLPPVWTPNGWPERLLVTTRERLWRPRILAAMREIDFWNFDVYQLDGGLEFFRDGRTVARLKEAGKTVICCYTGSDLRTRGVLPAIDALADLNVTLEFDHLALHPNIQHVFFPFETDRIPNRTPLSGKTVRIGHAPTNRAAKGSELIIATIESLAKEFPVELELIENVPYEESLRRKARCDIFVDQIGDLGYGLNSLESLAMGIPTCSCLAPGFDKAYPDHPLFAVTAATLAECLVTLICTPELRRERGKRGVEWVRRLHDSKNVVARIHAFAGLAS